ncbi:DUF4012 domain-containing protein [Patescibacteria group bacterium]
MKKESHKKKKSKIRRFGWIAATIAVLVIGFSIITGINYGSKAQNAYAAASDARTNFEIAKAAFENNDYNKAIVQLEEAQVNIDIARDEMKKLKFAKRFPLINKQYQAAEHLVNAIYQTNKSLVNTLTAANNIFKKINVDQVDNFSALTPKKKEEVLSEVHKMTPLFEGAIIELELAEIEIDKIPSYGISRKIKKYANDISKLLPQMRQGLELGISFSKIGPDLVGYPHEKRYLVLFLNNTELRPGGGFIGSYGIMKIKNGEIVDFPVSDSYDVDRNSQRKVEPPAPIRKYLTDNWYMRDANWSPDFPTSSEKVLEFYRAGSGDEAPIDGVIGLTPTLIRELLGIIGEVQVEGYPYKFTTENFTKTLEDAVEYDFVNLGISRENRKQILGDLNKTLMARLMALPREEWPKLASIMVENMEKKQMMIYVTDTVKDKAILRPVLSENNWDGHVIHNEEDYILLVDANVHGGKSDPVVQRHINYNLQLTNENKAIARAEIVYEHTGFEDKFTKEYNTYTRLMVPVGATFISIEGADSDVDVREESGKASFGYFLRVKPQTTKNVRLTYELPRRIVEDIEQNNYSLTAQKQLGSTNQHINFMFQGPNTITDMQPLEITKEKVSNNSVIFKTSLKVNRYFSLSFSEE